MVYVLTLSNMDNRYFKILFVISGIPLLIYPFVLAASLMGLTGYRDGGALNFVEIFAYFFYILTIIYPINSLYCVWLELL